MNGVVKINKCSVNKVMRVVHDTKNAYSVCLFTANYTKQAEAFPDNIQKYGTTALFKVSSYHLPAKLLVRFPLIWKGIGRKIRMAQKGTRRFLLRRRHLSRCPKPERKSSSS